MRPASSGRESLEASSSAVPQPISSSAATSAMARFTLLSFPGATRPEPTGRWRGIGPWAYVELAAAGGRGRLRLCLLRVEEEPDVRRRVRACLPALLRLAQSIL